MSDVQHLTEQCAAKQLREICGTDGGQLARHQPSLRFRGTRTLIIPVGTTPSQERLRSLSGDADVVGVLQVPLVPPESKTRTLG